MKIKLLDSKGKRIGKKKKTTVKNANLNPYYNESFVFMVEQSELILERNYDHTTNDNSTTSTKQATTQQNANSTKDNLKVRQFNKATIQQMTLQQM